MLLRAALRAGAARAGAGARALSAAADAAFLAKAKTLPDADVLALTGARITGVFDKGAPRGWLYSTSELGPLAGTSFFATNILANEGARREQQAPFVIDSIASAVNALHVRAARGVPVGDGHAVRIGRTAAGGARFGTSALILEATAADTGLFQIAGLSFKLALNAGRARVLALVPLRAGEEAAAGSRAALVEGLRGAVRDYAATARGGGDPFGTAAGGGAARAWALEEEGGSQRFETAAVRAMKAPELRRLATSLGADTADCIERADLERVALAALAKVGLLRG